MTYLHTLEEHDILEVELCAPPCNEIGTGMLAALEGVATTLSRKDPAPPKVMILHSSLKNGFCAGANLRELNDGLIDSSSDASTEQQLRQFIDRIHRVADQIDQAPLITIGVVHGTVFGGGFELALTCDMLIAEKSARFAFPESRLGLIPGFGGIPRLEREVPNAVIRDLLFSGRSIRASRAHELGWVAQLVNNGQGLTTARRLALQSAKFDRETIAQSKHFAKPHPKERLHQEKQTFLNLAQRPALKKALQKFTNNNTPHPYLP